jgi:phosphoribosylanthranilate isomerase
VDWIGLNFHPRSPRGIDPATAAEILAGLPPSVAAVGLFVDRPAGEVAEVARRLGLRIIQLHGDEPPGDLRVLHEFFVVRAFRLADAASVARMASYLDDCRALGRLPDAVLVDAFVSGQAGGTGRAIAPEALQALTSLSRSLPPLILAGGLTPENLSVRLGHLGVRPWMVDVASGVELAPGRKDPARVAAFVHALRACS